MNALQSWWHNHMPKVWGVLVAAFGAAVVSYPALAQSLPPKWYGIGLFAAGVLGAVLDFLKPKQATVVPPPSPETQR